AGISRSPAAASVSSTRLTGGSSHTRPGRGNGDPEREGDEVLEVEGGHGRAEGEADQRAADAAERVQQVSARRAEAAPPDAGDDTDPGGDDRREADVVLVDEVRESAAVDRCGRAAEAVHEQRREHVAGERGEDHDT